MQRVLAAPSALAVCLGCVLGVTSCRSPEARRCLAEFESAQAVVMQVKATEVDSVSSSVAAVESAVALCKQADRALEVAELEKAGRTLSQHLTRLREQLAKPKEVPLTPEQIAERIKSGDASCPRGQAYLNKQSGKHIRCTGPLPIEMSIKDAEVYFRGRGYKVDLQAAPPSLTVEFGAEKQVFRYSPADESGPPQCVVSYPPPEMSWQEATARLTGVAPNRLAAGKAIDSRRGKLALSVDEGPNRLIVKLGDCG